MNFLFLITGIVIGLLIKKVNYSIIRKRKKDRPRGETQFFEPISTKEVLKKSKTIDEFISKL